MKRINEFTVCDLIAEVSTCSDIPSLLALVTNFLHSTGARYFNYTHLDTQSNSKSQFLMHHNYTPEWVATYTAKQYATVDPVVFYVKTYNRPVLWNHACNIIAKNFILNSAQKQLIKDMIFDVLKHGIGNGIGIAVTKVPAKQYGFYIAYPDPERIPSHLFLDAICHIFNNAFMSITKDNYIYNEIKFPFSPQERVLVQLIYHGKERRDIAEIMDISVNTVDTMTKRIFVKMRVNSKMQLMSKIISKGWLNMLL